MIFFTQVLPSQAAVTISLTVVLHRHQRKGLPVTVSPKLDFHRVLIESNFRLNEGCRRFPQNWGVQGSDY